MSIQGRVRVLSLAVLAGLTATASGATLPQGFAMSRVASGLSSPTMVHAAPDGRIFVSEQAGRLRVIKNGTLLATPFLTVPVVTQRERGLFGVAFDPDFPASPYVYVYYTATTPSVHNRVSRFTAAGDVAQAGSEQVLLDLPPVVAEIHNGGAVHFGADGKLYITVGDNANPTSAQSLQTTMGKMLRINRDGTIPTDNPFYTSTTGINRAIWARGLRNPFTFAVQRGTGRIFINDVGDKAWEEINEGQAGANYGWPETQGATSDPRFQTPFHAYPWSTGGCAIVGGAFYNPPAPSFPASYAGRYFFGDHCNGTIRTIDPATRQVAGFASGLGRLSDLTIAPDGTLYLVNRTANAIERIRYTASQAPSIAVHPEGRTVSDGAPVTFMVQASGTAPLRYQWQRNGANIPGATAASYTFTAQLSDNGATFRCVVTNDFGTATSHSATLAVTSNRPPSASITTPAASSTFAGGETIAYAGEATDPEDGALPAAAFEWEIRFHHDAHWHPFEGPTAGAKSGSFTAATSGETSDNVWYRIILRVRDSSGLVTETFRDVQPRKAQVTVTSDPPGLTLTLDGQPHTAPFTFTGVVGVRRTLGAGTVAGQRFAAWSDGGAAVHEIATPAAGATYTATYREAAAYSDVTPAAAGVTASGSDVNVPANAVDDSLATRWSANGEGAWLRLDLGAVRTIGHATVAVFNGDSRRNRFDLQVSTNGTSWTTVWSGESSGTTTQPELYDFADTPARWLRYLGHGNSDAARPLWNSVAEIAVFAQAP